MSPGFEARGLVRSFGATRALAALDLSAEAGTVLGVLGPNGAGKTTAVRILATLLVPDEGSASVAGFDVVREPEEVRARIGLTGQYAALDERLTGRENLEVVGALYHLRRSDIRSRTDVLLERFDLVEASRRPVQTYSGGMRRRLDLAAGLVAQPEVLFLDEPTTGLDLRSRLAMWDLIEELVASGTTLLLTTQYLDEADHLAHQIVVVDHGTAIARGTPDELKRQVGGERLVITLVPGTDLPLVTRILRPLGEGDVAPDAERRTVTLPIARATGTLMRVIRALDDASIEVEDIEHRRPTLDDVFLALTGHEAADASQLEVVAA